MHVEKDGEACVHGGVGFASAWRCDARDWSPRIFCSILAKASERMGSGGAL